MANRDKPVTGCLEFSLVDIYMSAYHIRADIQI